MNTSLFSLALSGILVLISWIGWGWSLHRALRLHRSIRPGWPLLAALGMSLIIVLGGITSLFAITSAPLLITITMLGLASAFVAALAHFRRKKHRDLSLWLIPPIVLAAAIFISSIASTRLNPGDDQLAYMLFPRQMLQSGTLLAPFNMRRLGTYGGQQLLQAQLLAIAETLSPDHGERDFFLHGNVLDTGLCALIGAGLLWTLMRPRSSQQHILASLVVIMFLLTSVPRVNTHAQMSGTLLFLALFHLLKTLRNETNSRIRLAILAGLIAAALASLRMNFLPAAVLAIAFSALEIRARRTAISATKLVAALLAILTMTAALTPWAVVLFKSSGTRIYPLFKGFQQGPFLDAPLSFPNHLAWILSTILFPPILTLLAPLALAPWSRRLRSTLPLTIAAIATTLATAWAYTTVDAWMIFRYCSPLLIACAFAGLAMVLSRKNNSTAPLYRGAVLILLLIPCILASPFSEAFRSAYPILLGPALVIALCLPKTAPPRTRMIVLLLIITALIAGAIHNLTRMSDNSGLFFYFAATGGLSALAILSHHPQIKRIAAATAAVFFLAGLIAITRIFGVTLIALIGLLVIAASALVALTRAKLTPRRALFAVAITVIALFIAVANLPFILDTFSTALLAGSIGGLAYLAWSAGSTPMTAAAAGAIAILCLSTSTSPSGISLHPIALPIAWTTIAAALLAPRLSPKNWLRWTPALIYLGLLCLTLDEARLFATFTNDPAAELRYEQQSSLYRHAQESIPPAARIFTLVADPGFLDYRRNPIDESDKEIEFVSPPPKIPLTDSPLLLRHYFLTLGIRYVILSDTILQHDAGLPASFRRALTQLADTGRILFREPGLTVVEIEN